MKKILVAYYSWAGNTKDIAEKIKSVTNGDTFEIETIKPYPSDYSETVDIAKHEKINDYMPPLKGKVSTENYDIIFVGSPVWWYTMAPPIKTFLHETDLRGKIVVPFCTHGGGGASATFTDMEDMLPESKFLSGFVCYGNSATHKDIADWISGLAL